MDFAKLQRELPWGAHDYTEEFNERKDAVRDFEHAHGHVVKALGGLFEHVIDEHAHNGKVDREKATKKLADVLICLARMANVMPGGAVDLASAVVDRLAEKFPTRPETRETAGNLGMRYGGAAISGGPRSK